MSIVGYWNTSRSQSARTFVRRCSSQSKNTGLADGQLRMTVLMDSFSAIAEVRGERFEYSQGTRLNQCRSTIPPHLGLVRSDVLVSLRISNGRSLICAAFLRFLSRQIL